MNVIVFGCSGQDGQYLTALLENQGITVIGVDRSGKFHSVDLTDFSKVASFVKEYQPAFIFHLAADSTTKHSAWKSNHDTISTGTINILESVLQFSPTTKVFLAGSGLQFRNYGIPIKESDEFDATSIYAVSRIHMVYAARYYKKLGLKIYIGYFFNHDSPLRGERHINKKIANTVLRIFSGSREKLEIGNTMVRKEFGFAGDIVRAVWKFVNQERVFEVVIGTGIAYSIADWMEACFALKGLNWKEHITEKEGFIPEYELLVSNPQTIYSLGWKPEVDMNDLAQMMMKEP